MTPRSMLYSQPAATENAAVDRAGMRSLVDMKRSFIISCLLMWGCAMAPNQKVEVFGTVTDETGNDRLVLWFVEVELPIKSEGKAYGFHALDWESKDGAKWAQHLVISRADFQANFEQRRWVSKVQSFDAGVGRAVLQAAEEGPPDAAGTIRVTYSWREWDISNNREVRVIRVCKNPFELY